MFKSKILMIVSAFALSMPAAPLMARVGGDGAPITVTARHGDAWKAGNKKFQKGLKLRAKADRQHANAERNDARALADMENAKQAAINAEREFSVINGSASDFTDASAATDWVKSLDTAATRWNRAMSAQSKAQKAANKAFRDIRSAEAAQSKADSLMFEGRSMMASAERGRLTIGSR